MQKSLAILLLLVAVTLSTGETIAQERDPIDIARTFPPTYYKETEIALAQIDWQLQHLKQTTRKRTRAFQKFGEISAGELRHTKELAESLPVELRYANQEVRADLIGACLRELLSARLDVASNEEIISQLSKELEKAKLERAEGDVGRLKKESQQLKIHAAELKLSLVKKEYDQNKKFYTKGAKTRQEADRSQYALQIAEHELAQAKIEMEIENASRVNEIAQRLVEARIESQPIKARVEAAEKFLKLFSDSADAINRIDEHNRIYESIEEYSESFNRKMWASYDQIAELESLKELMEDTLEVAELRNNLEEEKKQKSDEKK